MPNKNTPPKHETQDSKLVTYKGGCTWQPVPLRKTRKDLND